MKPNVIKRIKDALKFQTKTTAQALRESGSTVRSSFKELADAAGIPPQYLYPGIGVALTGAVAAQVLSDQKKQAQYITKMSKYAGHALQKEAFGRMASAIPWKMLLGGGAAAGAGYLGYNALKGMNMPQGGGQRVMQDRLQQMGATPNAPNMQQPQNQHMRPQDMRHSGY
jgi:hypothetical protein